MDELIIDVRVNEYTSRARNAKVPFSPEEIARDAAECREAGAAIVHYHAREAGSGAPSSEPALYAETARRIRAASDILVMPTLGAGTVPDLEERFRHIDVMAEHAETRADFVPLDLATTNLPIVDPATGVLGGDDLAYHNTVGMLKTLAARAERVDALVMSAIWNVPSLRLLVAMLDGGILRAPAYCELFLTEGGLIAGHPATRAGLEALLPFVPYERCEWAVACYGTNALELAEFAIERGGHVALGLGDYDYAGLEGRAEPSNADVVAAVASIARAHGRALADPKLVRQHFGGEPGSGAPQ